MVPGGAVVRLGTHSITLTAFHDAFITAGSIVIDSDATFDTVALGDGGDIFVAAPGSGMQENVIIDLGVGEDRALVMPQAHAGNLLGGNG